jgi:hypothetical protein
MADAARQGAHRPRFAAPEQFAHTANDNSAAPLRRAAATASRGSWRRSVVRLFGKLATLAFSLAILAAIVIGWVKHEDGYLTPKEGVGYWLGIAGSAAMLLLLVYSVSKRVRSRSVILKVALWFRLHMILGLVGPTLILFHGNFSLGALNSNVALLVMLIVVGSGIVGRFLHRKISRDLHGHKAQIRRILNDAEELEEGLGGSRPAEAVTAELKAFTALVVALPPGALTRLWRTMAMRRRIRVLRRHLLSEIRRGVHAEAARAGWSRQERRRRSAVLTVVVNEYAAAARKVVALSLYERLFALWHTLHFPLFILLFMAAVIHIVAVHRY